MKKWKKSKRRRFRLWNWKIKGKRRKNQRKRKKYKDKDKEKDLVEKEIIKNTEPNKFITPLKSEENENNDLIDLNNKNSVKKNLENNEKDIC
jgi:hypothetical protein